MSDPNPIEEMERFAKGIQLGIKCKNESFIELYSNKLAEARNKLPRDRHSSSPSHRLNREKEEQKSGKDKIERGARLERNKTTDHLVEEIPEEGHKVLKRRLEEMKTRREIRAQESGRLAENLELKKQIREMKKAMEEKDTNLTTLRMDHELLKMENEILKRMIGRQEQAVEENRTKVTCAICMEPFGGRVRPQIGSCGHSICGMCKAALPRKHCPICREEFAFRFAKKNFLAEELLQIVNPYDGAQDLVPIPEAEEEREEEDDADLIEFSFTDFEADNVDLEDLLAARDDSGAESEGSSWW